MSREKNRKPKCASIYLAPRIDGSKILTASVLLLMKGNRKY